MPKIDDLVLKLKSLNLPSSEYAVFGSGPMAIRDLKEPGDLDVIVKQELWKHLESKYGITKEPNYLCVRIGEIDFFESWSPPYDIEKLINEADVIDGLRYVKLKTVYEWKKIRNKDKDKKDIEIIENYLK